MLQRAANRTSPCPFCTNKQLNAHAFLEWEYTSPITTHHYLLRDKLIDWEGREARLEIAFDITDHEREKESFKFLAGANGLNVECIRVLENEPLARRSTRCWAWSARFWRPIARTFSASRTIA